MRLRTRLLVLSVSTVAAIVVVLFALHLDSLTRVWIDNAIERSNDKGKQIQSLIGLRIADAPASATSSLAQIKRTWNRIIAGDQGLADMLVEQAAVRSGAIIEINIIGEDGRVLLSSIPARQGTARRSRPPELVGEAPGTASPRAGR